MTKSTAVLSSNLIMGDVVYPLPRRSNRKAAGISFDPPSRSVSIQSCCSSHRILAGQESPRWCENVRVRRSRSFQSKLEPGSVAQNLKMKIVRAQGKGYASSPEEP